MQRTSATCYFAYNDAAVHANARNHPEDDIKRDRSHRRCRLRRHYHHRGSRAVALRLAAPPPRPSANPRIVFVPRGSEQKGEIGRNEVGGSSRRDFGHFSLTEKNCRRKSRLAEIDDRSSGNNITSVGRGNDLARFFP